MKAAIVGHGIVGTGTANGLSGVDLVYYDEPKGEGTRDDVNACDFAIICVPTSPLYKAKPGLSAPLDLSIVKEVVEWVNTPVIIIRSTVPPGTCRNLSLYYNKNIVFVPAFFGELPTHPWKTDLDVGWMIIGADKDMIYPDEIRAEWQVQGLFRVQPTKVVSWEIAELVKMVANSWWATKVTFVNELYPITQQLGINWDAFRDAWLIDPRVGEQYTKSPAVCGPGFHGKCLPKDLDQLIYTAEQLSLQPNLLREVRTSNRRFRGEGEDVESLHSDQAAS